LLRPLTASGVVRFGYTSQIVPHKGLDLLIAAFERLPRGRAELHVWGSLELEPDYGRRIRQLADDVPGIKFHSGYTHEQVGDVLSAVDVVVVPSRCIENAPVVISEAFAALTPVIGSNAGGIAEAIQDGVNGLLFTRDSVDDLARCLEDIAEHPQSLERLRAGIPPVRTIADEADALLGMYERVVRSHDVLLSTAVSDRRQHVAEVGGA
jgi:glycosyltransferase involved in cell wall biosynthesis